jgi:hypothetical protein
MKIYRLATLLLDDFGQPTRGKSCIEYPTGLLRCYLTNITSFCLSWGQELRKRGNELERGTLQREEGYKRKRKEETME